MYDRLCSNTLIKKNLERLIKSNRLIHSVIIEGADGSGKHTLASIIGAAAACEDPTPPCDSCKICRSFSSSSHPDFMLFGPKKNVFDIDTVREIIREAGIMPIEAKRKVIVLEDCEKMSLISQNALLKVLEEPPGSVLFILLVPSAGFLLPTIRSRCITFSLHLPSLDEALPFARRRFSDKSESEILQALEISHCNLGRAFDLLNEQHDVKAAATAREILRLLETSDRYGLLKLCCGFEKDPALAKMILNEFILALTAQIKLMKSTDEDYVLSENAIIAMINTANDSIAALNGNSSVKLVFSVLVGRLFEDICL